MQMKMEKNDLKSLMIINHQSSNQNGLNHQPLTATSLSPAIRKEVSVDLIGYQMNVAQIWPCRSCGIMLGICHLLSGIILLIFDIVTNNISETVFAMTASLLFIVCGIFSFISARRLDRPAQLLLLSFSIFSLAMSVTMFVDSAALINNNCDQDDCHGTTSNVHVVLLCFGLIEFTISFVTMIVCFRSLRQAYRVRKASSPYSTLIEGHYDAFYITPRIVGNHKKNPKCRSMSSNDQKF